MNNEEAIEYLETDISRLGNTPQNIAHKEALRLGIDALRQQRTGHWIVNFEYINPEEDALGLRYKITGYKCSKCGELKTEHDLIAERTKFCPNCGSLMIEPQESEGKDGMKTEAGQDAGQYADAPTLMYGA